MASLESGFQTGLCVFWFSRKVDEVIRTGSAEEIGFDEKLEFETLSESLKEIMWGGQKIRNN